MLLEPITEQDIVHGLIYAAQSLNFTYDRMQSADKFRRFVRIRNGIIAENATERVLNAHGIVAFTTPLRTDWRLPDGPGDIAILASHGPIRRGDIKSLSFNDEVELRQKAWALVPQDQFRSKPKHVYIFAFTLWNNGPNPTFIYSNQAKMLGDDIPNVEQPLPGRTSFGISTFSRERRCVTHILSTKTTTINNLPDSAGDIEIDTVFTFTPNIHEYALNIVTTESHRHFRVDSSTWQYGDLGIGGDRRIYVAGWAPHHKIAQWEQLPKGSAKTHFKHTRTDNYGVPVSKLYSLEKLQQSINRIPRNN